MLYVLPSVLPVDVDLEVIARCNLVKSLTEDVDVVRQAVQLCSDLEVKSRILWVICIVSDVLL